jgi:hypothetical protein
MQPHLTQHELPATYVIAQRYSSVTFVQTIPGADIESKHSLLVANICIWLKKITKFRKEKSKMESVEVTYSTTESDDTLEVNVGAIECGSAMDQYQEMCATYDE